MPEVVEKTEINQSSRYIESKITRFDSIPNGLAVTALARVPGPLTYWNADGSKRVELVTPDFNRSFDSEGLPIARMLANLPVTLEHPPLFLRQDEAKLREYEVARTKPVVKVYRDGEVEVHFEVFDNRVIDEIRSGRKDGVSLGYSCNVVHAAGEWNGIHYDAVQSSPFEPDHLAIVKYPRAHGARITFVKALDSLSGYPMDPLDDTETTVFSPCEDPEQCECHSCKAKKKGKKEKIFMAVINGLPIKVDADEYAAIAQFVPQESNEFFKRLDAAYKRKRY